MLSAVSARHVLLSRLEEELLTARELETGGEERLDAQQKRVAQLKTSKNAHHQLSVRLLDTMRITHELQVSHVRLLEREIREASSE